MNLPGVLKMQQNTQQRHVRGVVYDLSIASSLRTSPKSASKACFSADC
jgi:hypothetical protein